MPGTIEKDQTVDQKKPKLKNQYTKASLEDALRRAQEFAYNARTSDEIVDLVAEPILPGGVGGYVLSKRVIGYRR